MVDITRTPEVLVAADRVQEAGQQSRLGVDAFRADDYEQRADVFAHEMGSLDVEKRAQLWGEVLEEDPGAVNSWLSANQVNELVDNGTISADEQSLMAEGFAKAYNDGQISYDDASKFLQIDFATQRGSAHTEAAYAAIPEFLNSSNGSEMTEFREGYGPETLQEQVDRAQNPYGGAPNNFRSALAVDMITDSGDTDMLARVYATFDSQSRITLLGAVGEASISYLSSGSSFDPLAALIESVGHRGSNSFVSLQGTGNSGQRSDTFGKMASEVVQFAADHKEYFYALNDSTNQPIDIRAEAMSGLFSTHRDEILNRYAEMDISVVRGVQKQEPALVGNVATLGNLFRLTALNENNSHQAADLNAIAQYASVQKEVIFSGVAERNVNVGRLAMLGSAMAEGLDQGYADLAKDEASRRAFAELAVNFALDVIRFPGAESAAKSIVADAFGTSAVSEAFAQLGSAGIDEATGQFTDAAEAQLSQTLGNSLAALQTLEEQKALIDAIVENAMLSGLNIDGGPDNITDVTNAFLGIRNTMGIEQIEQ
jgi:hypothetical protein